MWFNLSQNKSRWNLMFLGPRAVLGLRSTIPIVKRPPMQLFVAARSRHAAAIVSMYSTAAIGQQRFRAAASQGPISKNADGLNL